MIKFLIVVLVIAAAAYALHKYREAKRRELAEREADAWLKFYAGYNAGNWTPGSRRPAAPKNDIGVIRRAEPSGTNSPAPGGTGTQRTGGGYSVTREKRIF